MASLNGVTIRNLKGFNGHEGEPLFQGSVYLNGQKLGFWSQDAHGGSDNYDFNTKALVEQNIKAEICAQNVYLGIMKACKEIDDSVTYKIARDILVDEEEHEQDLEDFLSDFEVI